MEHTFSLKVNGIPGLLSRVEALFRRQGISLRRCFFEETAEGGAGRLLIVADSDEALCALLKRQLRRLHDVYEVLDAEHVRAIHGSHEPQQALNKGDFDGYDLVRQGR